LVSLKDVVSAADREDIDREAERIVARAYRAACRDTGRVERAFDLAVEAYRNHYPHVPKRVVGTAVAHILARFRT
jgi:predicted SnoaL-like aldol condensation-catalyzing enzyme